MKKEIKIHSPQPIIGNSRRQFLKMSGLAVAGAGFMFACNNDDDGPAPDPQLVFDLGAGDLGILNYAFALEQLEAAFYTNVVNSFYSGIADNERQLLLDLYYHELIHRDFFSAAISSVAPDGVLPTLEFNFNAIDFNNRDQVLATAKVLEDTGVTAYNGAAQFLTNPDYLVVAGKIVSVEARHASAIATIINPGSVDFAGDNVLVDLGGSGLAYDGAKLPSEVLAAVVATGFVVTPFTANSLQ